MEGLVVIAAATGLLMKFFYAYNNLLWKVYIKCKPNNNVNTEDQAAANTQLLNSDPIIP